MGLRTLAFLSLLALPLSASAQQDADLDSDTPARIDLDAAPRPVARAARAPGPIRVDGTLDDDAWRAAPVIDRFVQQMPDAGMPATERTEVRILYDDRYLYVGAELYDSDPGGLVIPTLQRDPNTRNGDAFGISLDTFLDGKSAFSFFINPGGALRDTQTDDDGRINNAAWDSAYELETRTHERGWTVELAVPWSSLRFDGTLEDQVWGMNLLRRIRRKNEDAVWAPADRRWALYTMSRAGRLEGISGVEPGRNLTLKPYVLAGAPSGTLRTGDDNDFDAGADLKYGVTPGLTLDVTYNTDFSQVEADDQQVNLTRFSLFFPEKREFFLENAGIFQFGDAGQYDQRNGATNRDFTLFHSRRIGITPQGAPLPILGGARVSGVAGPMTLGVLNMQTRTFEDLPAENFTVARVRGEALPGLSAGAIFVNRSSTSGPVPVPGTPDTPGLPGFGVDNRSWGVDADYQGVNDYLTVQTYLAATEGTAVDGTPLDREWAGRVSAAWRDPFWEVVAMYRRFGDDFDPGVGFVRRRGIHHTYGALGVRPRLSWPLLQELNPYVEAHRFTDLGGELQTREVQGGLGFDFRDGATGSISVTDAFERVDRPFTVSGATVPAGTYSTQDASATYTSNQAAPLAGRLTVSGGDYFGGDRRSVSGTVYGRLSYRALVEFSAQRNLLDLPGQGEVSANVYGGKLDVFFTRRVLTSAFVQYNQAQGVLATNLRFNWIHAPLSDLYIVLTERRDTQADVVLERLLSLKVTKLLGF